MVHYTAGSTSIPTKIPIYFRLSIVTEEIALFELPNKPVQPIETRNKKLFHLLSTDALPAELMLDILKRANTYVERPTDAPPRIKPITNEALNGMTVATVFFENSTRTRSTFDIAAQRLHANLLNLDIRTSSTSKGESLADTLHNLEAMGIDIIITRHESSGAAHFFAKRARTSSIINAGDGRHAHPTQALLDMLTIYHEKQQNFADLKVAIIGDIKYSRVARSEIFALRRLGVGQLAVAGPTVLMPKGIEDICDVLPINDAVRDADVVIMLRMQRERMRGGMLPSMSEYHKLYALNDERLHLTANDAIIMHPGPVNRGVEITSDVADLNSSGRRSVILDQVTNGVAVRMAIMEMIAETRRAEGLA